MGFVQLLRQAGWAGRPAAIARDFARARKSAVAVEFALVGLLYFLVLLVAVEGGIFYLKVDTLDLATERASRLLIINNSTTAPSTPAAFITDIANSANGVLQPNNIAVSVTVAAPVSVTKNVASGGFQSLVNATFTPNTFNFDVGSCAVKTAIVAGTYTSTCTSANNAKPCVYPTTLGLLDQGYQTITGGVTYLNQVYTCMAGQDVLVQVQYTDSTLTKLVSFIFGPIISTMAFQAEPSDS